MGESWSLFEKKNRDSQFIQNRAALVFINILNELFYFPFIIISDLVVVIFGKTKNTIKVFQLNKTAIRRR